MAHRTYVMIVGIDAQRYVFDAQALAIVAQRYPRVGSIQ